MALILISNHGLRGILIADRTYIPVMVQMMAGFSTRQGSERRAGWAT